MNERLLDKIIDPLIGMFRSAIGYMSDGID